MAFRIVSDSSSNLFSFRSDIDYRTVPLKVYLDERCVEDTASLARIPFLADMRSAKEIKTSCPNIQEWLDAFEGADEIFALTISSNLSGSYNAAETAKGMYVEQHPDAKVYVLDTKATAGEMCLAAERIADLHIGGESFETIRERIEAYNLKLSTLFSLESLNNLAKNGRVNPAIAKVAGLLGIRFIGTASEEGTIKQVLTARGGKKAVTSLITEMIRQNYSGGKVIISHSDNLKTAETIRNTLLTSFPNANIRILENGALCATYSEVGGIILGFETAEAQTI